MIVVNFKTYSQASGEKALRLAKICQAVSQKAKLPIIPAVQAADIWRLTSQGVEVWAQHVDDIEPGPNTGQVLLETLLAAGASGTLLNHSENKLPVEMIGTIIKKIRAAAKKFKILVCAESIEEAQEIEPFKPDWLAYEPPELIGSQTSSVTTAKPEVIEDFAREIKTVPPLVGAGVHAKADVARAIELGAKGILVSSDVVLAQEPQKELTDLATGFVSQK